MSSKPAQAKEVFNAPQLSADEEDALIHARITNDERPLRRLTKKFHTYASVAYPPIVEPPPFTTSSVEEAREAFLIELASLQLLLRKSCMVCDAERRQVDVYRKEKYRIENEHTVLKSEIEDLKSSLEQAQLERRRKIEYDLIAEKINVLPSREELELSIAALENDMQIIRDEHDTQNRSILARKSALDSIVADLSQLRILGKDVPKTEANNSRAPSEPASPAPAASGLGMDVDGRESANATEGEGERDGDGEGSTKRGASLNPVAKVFTPHHSTPLLQTATHQLRLRNSASGSLLDGAVDTPTASRDVTPAPMTVGGPDSSPLSPPPQPSTPTEEDKREDGEEDEEGEEGEEAEDIEMGEVSEKERGGGRGRKLVEDKEEGETSDESSVLSDPPDE